MNRKLCLSIAVVAISLFAAWGSAAADSTGQITFESPTYAPGTINAQDGWSSLGAAHSGCAVYDHAVVTNAGAPASFGAQSLRISNAVTSGCFGDQTFSKPLTDEAGETAATNNGMSGGVRQRKFEASFDFISADPSAQQTGLAVSVSPDRGDGSRQSYVRLEDNAGGIDVFFDDVQGTGNPANFVETQIGFGLNRNVVHRIRFVLVFADGPSNDVAQVFIDGALKITGTTWENYYRYDTEAAGEQSTRTVDSLLFRTGGDPAPATAGKGFLFDNVSLSSSTPPSLVPCTSVCYVNGATGSDSNGGGSPFFAKKTIQAAVDTVSSGGQVIVAKGTYTENVVIATPLTLTGAGDATKIIPALSGPNPCSGQSLCSGASNLILVQANDVTISRLQLDGDNPALTSGVLSGGVDVDARNGIITDHTTYLVFNNLTVQHVTVKNIFLRGIYASSGGTFNFHDDTVTNVQGDPASIAMFNFGGAGTMANNHVSYANDAISSNWSAGVQFLDNVVTHSGSGIHTDNAAGPGDLIQGNSVSKCQVDGYGIFVFVPYVAPTVKNNSVTGCAVGFAAFGGANPVTTNVINNEFDGAGAAVSVPDTSDGIFVTTDQLGYGDASVAVSLTNNSVQHFAFGLQVTQNLPATATVTVDSSLVSHNSTGLDNQSGSLNVTNSCVNQNRVGFLNESGGVTTAHRNSITQNSQFAVNNTAANVLNAENNWWGSVFGARLVGANKINSAAAVDAVPFLFSDHNTCQFDEHHVGAPSHGDHGGNGGNGGDGGDGGQEGNQGNGGHGPRHRDDH